MKRILVLAPPNFAGGLQFLLERYLARAKLTEHQIKIVSITNKCLKKVSKTKYTWHQANYPKFKAAVESHKPDFIICMDKASLGYITQRYISLTLTHGSIFKFSIFDDTQQIPCLILDDIKKVNFVPEASWYMLQDLKKAYRWVTNTQRTQPMFKYTVCDTRKSLDEFKQYALNSKLIGLDIETTGQGKYVLQSCSGYACLQHSGQVHTFVIPFINTSSRGFDGAYWENPEDEIYAFEIIKQVHDSEVFKILQNGSYDSAHYITYHHPIRNYFFDTLHFFHAIWPESPKRLDFISSLALDYYCYWKDESKEDEKADAEKSKLPETVEGYKSYWLYNALDCYNTLMSALWLVNVISQPSMKWAVKNYRREFRLQTGPALAGSMRGVQWNKQIQATLNLQLLQDSNTALDNLRSMVGDPNFNPNSPRQVSTLIYDILKAEELQGKGRTSNETILKLVITQHPLIARIVKQIWAVKKPLNNASKYGTLPLLNNRFMYKISAAGTETWRFATKQSDFWVGSNVQNIPEDMRILFEADKDYVMFDFDYSQSDAYFTAFTSQDPRFIQTMLAPEDTHLIHAEHFFKIPFDKLLIGKQTHAAWCVHKIKGVRSVTKRIVYGANYLMTAYTLFITMGLEAVQAAAEHLGYKDAKSWEWPKLKFLCGKFLESYFKMYNHLPVWLNEEIELATKNYNLVTGNGGEGYTRWFFSNLKKDKAAQRQLAAFFGQSGSASNINEFLDAYYYKHEQLLGSKMMFFFQVHDSIIGQVHKNHLHLLKDLKIWMERDNTIHGRTFKVPVEGQVGIGWGKRMVEWHPEITYQEILQHENSWWDKWRKNSNIEILE